MTVSTNSVFQDEEDDDDEEEEEEQVKTHEQYIQGEAEEDAQLAWELFEVKSVAFTRVNYFYYFPFFNLHLFIFLFASFFIYCFLFYFSPCFANSNYIVISFFLHFLSSIVFFSLFLDLCLSFLLSTIHIFFLPFSRLFKLHHTYLINYNFSFFQIQPLHIFVTTKS